MPRVSAATFERIVAATLECARRGASASHAHHVAAIVSAVALAACASGDAPSPHVSGGDADRGRAVLERYECGVCHVIPGIPAATGQVGPALDHYAQRPHLAGKFPNEPDTLVRWIRDAPAMAPQTAMPAIAMSQQEARDAAAYLYMSE